MSDQRKHDEVSKSDAASPLRTLVDTPTYSRTTLHSSSPHASTLGKSIFLAALLVALGNIASRVLGLARNSTVAYLFGRASVEVNAYNAAWLIPNTLYDFLINGAISAALVPVFSAYAEDRDIIADNAPVVIIGVSEIRALH